MAISARELRHWILGGGDDRRRTQDSPIMPDVWIAYGEDWPRPVDLLLTPHAESDAVKLAEAVRAQLGLELDETAHRFAYNRAYIAIEVDLYELIQRLLPLSVWWEREIAPVLAQLRDARRFEDVASEAAAHLARKARDQGRHALREDEIGGGAVWLIGLVGRIATEEVLAAPDDDYVAIAHLGLEIIAGAREPELAAGPPPLWAINRNRTVQPTVNRSRITVKADAATRLFELSCRDLRWAVIDSGIDATHPAFRRRDAPPGDDSPAAVAARSRIYETYDFTRLRGLFARRPGDNRLRTPEERQRSELQEWLESGRSIDWALFEQHLRVDYADADAIPVHEHGTHVAGVLAGEWLKDEERESGSGIVLEHDIAGVCPDLGLLDLRVMNADGIGDEFALLAALQYVRWRNLNSTVPVIHGVNLSLSLAHDAGAYACGRTPVCEECERLLGNAIVVVAAAGNLGEARFTAADGIGETTGARLGSITDPGNAAGVITVGATHRDQPHIYGVSFFSSRGPTSDGRRKPDLVAPGEKITAPVPNRGLKTLDGTSQAAPHVSGSAALLMARHPELIGDPARVKAVLCASATDLGRESYFQGAGLVDALRAIQAV